MSAEVNDVNQHTLINIPFPSISLIEVIFKIKLPNKEIISLKGMIDKGSTKSHLDISYVPKECRSALAMRQSASTMTFAQLHIDEGLRDAHIFFLSSDDKEEWYPLPQTWLSPVNHRFEFLIGLNFICANFGGLIMTFDYISFFKHVTTTPTEYLISKNFTSELSRKRGGTHHFPDIFAPIVENIPDETFNIINKIDNPHYFGLSYILDSYSDIDTNLSTSIANYEIPFDFINVEMICSLSKKSILSF